MRVTILASGSKGNATLYQSGETAVLVDAGISVSAVSALVPRLDAIVVTHAHSDHVGNYARLARKLKARVFLSEATARSLDEPAHIVKYSPREPFAVGALTIAPTPLPHDAAQVALVISDREHKVGLATDLGEVPPGLVGHLRGCDALLIESNHDIGMLITGPYRDFLKKRIASAKGHLSNDQTCELLRAHYRDARSSGQQGAAAVTLMHLSEQNNQPQIALKQARDVLSGLDVRLSVASQTTPLAVDLSPRPQLSLW